MSEHCHWRTGNATGTTGEHCGNTPAYRDNMGRCWCRVHSIEAMEVYDAKVLFPLAATASELQAGKH